ncbi:hypothetical protein E2C01_097066 [Portunus trituberculatus]|uniref:Uncharacterized protein n=1 Tax=Portunus trituberculatus TaxID=210409 RepID=A0A5B7K4Q1_PORTR|nr:hypothetical protein [Portunus trituberculatus]
MHSKTYAPEETVSPLPPPCLPAWNIRNVAVEDLNNYTKDTLVTRRRNEGTNQLEWSETRLEWRSLRCSYT